MTTELVQPKIEAVSVNGRVVEFERITTVYEAGRGHWLFLDGDPVTPGARIALHGAKGELISHTQPVGDPPDASALSSHPFGPMQP